MAPSACAQAHHDELLPGHVVSQLLPFIGYPRTLNGLRAVDEVTAA